LNELSQPEYPQPLVTFCQGVVSRFASQWPPEESKLADEFIAHFSLPKLATFESQLKLCESLGIRVSEAALPENLRGHNCCYGNQREIQIHNGKGHLITRERTLLHELREILEHIFHDMGYPTAKERAALEVRAETFASCVKTDIFGDILKDIFQAAAEIGSKWKRWGAFFLLALFGIAGLFSIMMFPAFEDQILDADSRNPRNVRNVRSSRFSCPNRAKSLLKGF
jgi:hypothetical protein